MKIKLCKAQCDQCLFSKHRIVTLAAKNEIVAECIKEDKHFLCHKGTIMNEEIVCRGFYNMYTSKGIRMAKRLQDMTGNQFIQEVDPFELYVKFLEKKKGIA